MEAWRGGRVEGWRGKVLSPELGPRKSAKPFKTTQKAIMLHTFGLLDCWRSCGSLAAPHVR